MVSFLLSLPNPVLSLQAQWLESVFNFSGKKNSFFFILKNTKIECQQFESVEKNERRKVLEREGHTGEGTALFRVLRGSRQGGQEEDLQWLSCCQDRN